jgi:hypothetical protein
MDRHLLSEWHDLTADGKGIATQSDYCGVRAVQGKHRAFVIDFIRDARVGWLCSGRTAGLSGVPAGARG